MCLELGIPHPDYLPLTGVQLLDWYHLYKGMIGSSRQEYFAAMQSYVMARVFSSGDNPPQFESFFPFKHYLYDEASQEKLETQVHLFGNYLETIQAMKAK